MLIRWNSLESRSDWYCLFTHNTWDSTFFVFVFIVVNLLLCGCSFIVKMLRKRVSPRFWFQARAHLQHFDAILLVACWHSMGRKTMKIIHSDRRTTFRGFCTFLFTPVRRLQFCLSNRSEGFPFDCFCKFGQTRVWHCDDSVNKISVY